MELEISHQQPEPLAASAQPAKLPLPVKTGSSEVVRGKRLTPSQIASMTHVSPEKRFWMRVEKRDPNECWPWLGHTSNKGYGILNVDRKPHFSHRYAYELANGPIPDDMCVCHSCDNRPCCNPAHLWLGTKSENTMDRVHKGRTACGERQGASKLTYEQVTEMKQIYRRGSVEFGLKALGVRFGVATSVVGKIINGQSWRHHTP